MVSKVREILFCRIGTHTLQRLRSRLIGQQSWRDFILQNWNSHTAEIEEQIGQQSWRDFILQNWDSHSAEIEEQIGQHRILFCRIGTHIL